MYKENPISIYCPLTNSKQTVYIQTLDDSKNDIHIKRFNGCESSFHKCPECDSCEKNALALFNSQSD